MLPSNLTQASMAGGSGWAASPVHLPQFQNGVSGDAIEISADSFNVPLSDHEAVGIYGKPAVFLEEERGIDFAVEIEEAGEYTIWFDTAVPEAFITPPEGQLLVDGEFISEEAPRIVFPVYYQDSGSEFPLDRYGNETLIKQENLVRWTTVPMRDPTFIQGYPLQVHFEPGNYEFEFTVTNESLLLGSIYIEPFVPYPSYQEYLAEHDTAVDTSGVFIEMEAEHPAFKNNTSIRAINNRSLEITPYDTYQLVLNALGGETWNDSGSTVYYAFTVPETGMYHISFHVLQNLKSNFVVFRRITIDDAILFEELNQVPFEFDANWENVTLGGEEPFEFYLEAGTHVLGIEATASPYKSSIDKVQTVLLDINDLSLEIKRLTGNQVDPFKDWVISDYIPDIEAQLLGIAANLQEDLDGIKRIEGSGGSPEELSYQMAIDNITFLAEDPDEIPTRMNRFSEGSGSASQLLGALLPLLQSQPLTLDKVYIHSADSPPETVKVSPLDVVVEGLKRFFHSFQRDPYQTIGAQDDELEVWVNRSRQYVDMMQLVTDESFTNETGIKVKFSIMPDESKLILANAAGIQPDVAFGVSTDRPYELAIRNALMDLRSFEDFDAYIGIYRPGSLLSYIINDSVYALPETQDFWVTYYRKDIMDSLGIPIPETWPEVIEILPELQRFGMNYNTVLSSGSGFKNYLMTAPYLFNQDADLYSDDGFATGLESDEAIAAVRFMAESFTIYGMPLTTSSFYESFRYGQLPVGISNFTTYLQLVTTAPELNGLWELGLYPGTVLQDGRVLHYATGSAQSGIMFANTDKKDEGWEFMKWWMSTETQVDFQQQLILNYGYEYLWNSANVEAFAQAPIPDQHKAIILEQWQWLQEPVKLPGSYMQERELSNAWNRIVFDGVNPRVAIDNSVIIINREITRKMEEFGYLENGVVVREFEIPTLDKVEGWMEDGSQ